MNCDDMHALVVRAQGRETDSSEDALLAAHVTMCGGCAAYARDVRLLWAWMGEAVVPPRRAAWVGVAAAAAVLLGILGFVVRSPAQDEPGIELTYRAVFEEAFKGSKAEVTARTARVLARRLENRGLKGGATAKGDDTIVVRLPGATPEDVATAKALLARVASLQLRPVADKATHETFAADGKVPDGYEKFPPPEHTDDHPWLRGGMLVRKQAIVTNEDIARAVAAESLPKPRWKIDFEMTDSGAAAFDVAAKELFSRAGHLAIVLDGKLLSAPIVRAEKFGGKGELTGNHTEAEAKDLAAALKGAALPVAIKLEGEARFEK